MERSKSSISIKISHSQKPAESPEKREKSTSYNEKNNIKADFEDILYDINFKKRLAYNIYSAEMMVKDNLSSIVDPSKTHSKEWQKLPESEIKKYKE
jgi:hypothetical protein